MEVLNPRIVSPDSSLLKEIQNIINRGEGLNAAKDVEVALLTQVHIIYQFFFLFSSLFSIHFYFFRPKSFPCHICCISHIYRSLVIISNYPNHFLLYCH